MIGDEKITDDDKTLIEDVGLKVYTLEEVYLEGMKDLKGNGESGLNPANTDDVFILSYTSGTTGVPKGVKITHRQVLNVAFAVNSRME